VGIWEYIRSKSRLRIISNRIDNAEAALGVYRDKDVVEKGFYRMKNSLGLNRLRVHSDAVVENKIFIIFIALILESHIQKILNNRKLKIKIPIKKLFKILNKIKEQTINGKKIIGTITKEQRSLLKDFKIPIPK
jgi:transposase